MTEQTIPNLMPESKTGAIVTPETPVVCINRGRREFRDQMFDGEVYTIPPGLFSVQMKVAKHFRARLVVPGTRSREDFTEQSFIAILGTSGGQVMHDEAHGFDPIDKCVPFTDEELDALGEAKEALDRSGENMRYISTKTVASSRGVQAEGRTRNIAAIDGTGEQIPVSDVLTPSDEPNAARMDAAEAPPEMREPRGGAPDASIKGTRGGKTLKGVKDSL